MPSLRDIRTQQFSIYQDTVAAEVNLMEAFYPDPSASVAHPKTHIHIDNRLLLVYLLAKQGGLSDEEEIHPGFEELVQFFTFPYLKDGPKEADFEKVVRLNTKFKKIVDQFLNNEHEKIRPLVVAVSEEGAINSSHFNAFVLKKEGRKLVITMKDSILAGHHFESPEFNLLKSIMGRLFPSPQYELEFSRVPVASQDNADCLIHTVHNLLAETFGEKYSLKLNPEVILKIRQDMVHFLTRGTLPEATERSGIQGSIDVPTAQVDSRIGSDTTAGSSTGIISSLPTNRALLEIIQKIQNNISGVNKTSRWRPDPDHQKVKLLQHFADYLKKTDLSDDRVALKKILMCLDKILLIKRNPWNFFHSPHSHGEFRKLIKPHQDWTELLENERLLSVHLDDRLLSQVNSADDIETLLRRATTYHSGLR